ncbi:peptidoglycan/LPS O-acetylase OafA/YrhL [Paenibacillus anaericanus]|uniref:acyltransferase family protein n=1 Tax=Paenibacillus anaericanus TaxID=170367 RepID=UPI002782A12D|nr:acyltransferase [Paenibacillus anaericanus]MDQ0091059.1 peptidoglycan/LPS O-acetylase OafA/YrhL [Paenibacillus anaericanus]
MQKINKTLVGLRGFLALSVVIFHIYGSSVLEGYIKGFASDNILYAINYAGPISVNLFFVISGYLILKSLTTKQTMGQFLKDRTLRIYPVFLTIHISVFIMGPIIGYKWMNNIDITSYVVHFISNLLLLPGMFNLPIAQIVAWSLSYEAAFYLIAGTLFFVWKKSNKLTLHAYFRYTFVSIMALVCIAIFYFRPAALFFTVGILVFLCESTIKRWFKPRKVFYLGGIITLGLLYLSYYMQIIPTAIILVLSLLLFITIIVEYGLLSSILRLGPMQYLGKISYSLYMWHTMVMFPLKKVMGKISLYIHNPSILLLIYIVSTITLSILVSHLSYTYIEKKLTNNLRGLWDKKI